MIQINQLKLPVGHTEEALIKKAARLLHIPPKELKEWHIVKKSLDARNKPELFFIYTITVKTDREDALLSRVKSAQIMKAKESSYHFPACGKAPLNHPPVIIGTGPAGLFCGLMLARAGYHPILLERGKAVEERRKDVDAFWRTGSLNPNSNVQFGEGGAGTFSDGKLNTLVKDPLGRNKKVLEIFAQAGADPSILYTNKPHVGTDVLMQILIHIRQEILHLGGEIRFENRVTDFTIENNRLTGLVLADGSTLSAEAVVLAVGHSARDTFEMLHKRQVPMESKAFAVGLRIEHPQSMINLAQYGNKRVPGLGAADYKLTHQCANGRGVYSFCMCPGGFVVNASSEENRLAVNGMSYHSRGGENANSAMIVTVTPEDYGSTHPLAGVAFQRRLEEKAFCLGGGRIPCQLFGDFKEGKASTGLGDVSPQNKGGYVLTDLSTLFPHTLNEALIEGVTAFDRQIAGFGRIDAVLSGVESRTSSPVKIPRDSHMESEIKGLFPCGEGAGYAGGITSAAMDGMKIAEEIAGRYRPQ